MAKLSDSIEEFILSLLNACDDTVDLKRNELAEYFGCVPSQINYVIATRFTLDKGYLVESKKGGGGYVRIIKRKTDGDDLLMYLLKERIGSSISYKECEGIIFRLRDHEFLSNRESALLLCTLKDAPVPINQEMKDIMRAYILKNAILTILNGREENKNAL